MNTKHIAIGQCRVSVPDYFQQVDSTPEDPEESIPLMAQSESAVCLVALQPLSPEDAMPFDNSESVIEGIHECLDEEQGLIEVEAGGKVGSRYVYSIVKTLKNPNVPEGVQYTLTLDREYGDKIIHAQGFFDEQGITGMRDSMVFAMFKPESDLEERMSEWTFDPYDPEYKHGHLMNQSELIGFDEHFPAHPLSMAREFARVMCG